MLDVLTSLAFSVHSGKGVYALLLGSGLSRAAGIPTGWEVALDLIRKTAAIQGEDCNSDPASWYRAKFGSEPDYSALLAKLALTPSERANALAAYFEPTEEDRETGKKVPTAAHHSIARMVAKGYFRVVLTTNFDRLMEQALDAAGVQPMVISSTDAVKGAVPLTHSTCTVIKIHGDYRDTRIRNTSEELASYDPEINTLLDRIFDEYGLIVCGWSGTWDEALRKAILRSPNRRYSMTWAARGVTTDEARQIIEFRQASEMAIDSADKFFPELESKLDALESYDAPHPLSATLAIALMKRFIVSEEHRIELHDLVSQEMERQMTSLSKLAMSQSGLTLDQLFERVQRYERALDILGPIIAQGCYWGNSGQAKLWATALERTAELARIAGGMTLLLQLRMYPTCMLLYLGGLSAVAANRYDTLKTLCTTEIVDNGQTTPLILKAMPPNVLENDWARKLPGLERRHTPMSDRLFGILREHLREFVPSDQRYDDLFDRFEYLMSLIYFDTKMKKDTWRWAPVGRYSWKDSFSGNTISTQIAEEQQRDGKDWPPLKAGLFESESRFLEVKAAFDAEILAKARFM